MPFNNNAGDTTTAAIPAGCRCETCKLARFESSTIRGAVVHAYSFRPRTWKLNKVANDPHDYYLGVELECDNYLMDRNGSRVRSSFSNEQAADMRRPKNLWLAKRDGSVSGPEFVSHPSTLAYWAKHEVQLREMFQMLVHAGFRSHDNDHAGMHINISKNAFADSAHLYRFLTMVHGNVEWSLKMSQRTASSAEQWASVTYLQDEERRQREVENIMPDHVSSWNRPRSSQRYQAVNCPPDGHRFEFRLPRGTFRFDRFMKNLEWTVGMVEYSRTGVVADMTPTKFMRWVVDTQATVYPNLVKYIAQRFTGYVNRADATANNVVTDATGQRISPRTGLPMRAYNRREGAVRQPGRPVGYSPRATRVVSSSYVDECGVRSTNGLFCEYTRGHRGLHGAPSVRQPDFPRNTIYTFADF